MSKEAKKVMTPEEKQAARLAKKKKHVKKATGIIAEFKKFITRGNVIDLAVGVIIGSAFTAIVNALANGILKPLINWFIAVIAGGEDALKSAVTYLKVAYDETGEINLASSIYIDWGSLISAIINFFLIALVLFAIVKAANNMKELAEKTKDAAQRARQKQQLGLKLTRKERKALALAEAAEAQAKAEAEAKKAADAAAQEAYAAKVREAEARDIRREELLRDIRDLLKNK